MKQFSTSMLSTFQSKYERSYLCADEGGVERVNQSGDGIAVMANHYVPRNDRQPWLVVETRIEVPPGLPIQFSQQWAQKGHEFLSLPALFPSGISCLPIIQRYGFQCHSSYMYVSAEIRYRRD
jgi:hypothetical protein